MAKESSEYFKEELVTTAKAFVKKMYGVDCSEAKVHAYGYSIKIAVQLEVAPDQIFHVRFYYDNPEPVGILFYNDVEVFNEADDKNQLKLSCGYGAVFGRNENKAIAMAVLDHELSTTGDFPTQNDEFV